MKKLRKYIMEHAKKSKKVIAITIILAIIIIVGIIIGVVIWNRNNQIAPGSAKILDSHTMTREEMAFVSGVLPSIRQLFPEKFDGDIKFAYETHACGGGISEKRLKEIKDAYKKNDKSVLNEYDFSWLRSYNMSVKRDNYELNYAVMSYRNWGEYYIFENNGKLANKDDYSLNISRFYYLDGNTCIKVDVYPLNVNEKLGDRSWSLLSKEEKIELFGREWFDSVELSDIDEFMKEVCAYNGINSDWLDNKPVYNIK